MRVQLLIIRFIVLLGCSGSAAADYKDDIGYTRLVAEQGTSPLDGSAVAVTQVEASTAGSGNPAVFLPDAGVAELSTKNITDRSGSTTGTFSGHATSVGKTFYGNTSSIAPGISTINAYWADGWLQPHFLRFGDSWKPLSSADRVANHSWIGSFDDSDILRRTDWVVENDEFIQCVGIKNSSSLNDSLLSGAYNIIAVGKSDGNNGYSTRQLDNDYVSGRVRPEIVAPKPTSSSATPVVAAAAALLIGAGHASPCPNTDPVQSQTSNRAGNTICNAERSEVVKAVLMAGADRVTSNNSSADISDYRAIANQADNGLDDRFGAGQVNIYNSFHIVAAGEQNSDEDSGIGSGEVLMSGFDYDPSFGGAGGSNTTATYRFSTGDNDVVFSATLAWNIEIDGGNGPNFSGAAVLHNLNLTLYDVTGGSQTLLQGSAGAIDNTETIWISLDAGKDYLLQVSRQGAFSWDFALAWQALADTDSDALPDSVDIDDDNDGLLDVDEVTQHDTDPLLVDTDGDGFDDAMELTYGSDPTSGGSGSTPADNVNNNGDINGDTMVNVVDILLATRIVLGELVPTPEQRVRADMVPDGVINAGDLVRIQQLALGL
jgi:hypothetical protein